MANHEEFDFGFTAVDEDQLKAVQQTQQVAQDAEKLALTTKEKCDRLYNMIKPLLNNLQANPEKEYIYWPNRLEKLEEFSDMLDKVYRG